MTYTYDKFIDFLKDNDISYFVNIIKDENLTHTYLAVHVKTNCNFINTTFDVVFYMHNKKYVWSKYVQRKYNYEEIKNINIDLRGHDAIYDEHAGDNTLHVCCDTFSKRLFNKIIRQQKWYK